MPGYINNLYSNLDIEYSVNDSVFYDNFFKIRSTSDTIGVYVSFDGNCHDSTVIITSPELSLDTNSFTVVNSELCLGDELNVFADNIDSSLNYIWYIDNSFYYDTILSISSIEFSDSFNGEIDLFVSENGSDLCPSFSSQDINLITPSFLELNIDVEDYDIDFERFLFCNQNGSISYNFDLIQNDISGISYFEVNINNEIFSFNNIDDFESFNFLINEQTDSISITSFPIDLNCEAITFLILLVLI